MSIQSQPDQSLFSREDDSLEQFQQHSNQHFFKNKLGKISNDQFKSHFNQFKRQSSIRFDIQQRNDQQISRRRINSNSEKIVEQSLNSKRANILDQSDSANKNDMTISISNMFRSKVQSINISYQNQKIDERQQEDKDKILQGLKPLFYEMRIIKKVFRDLESLVNYQIDAHNQNQQDIMNTLFHFSKAKSTFLQLNNMTGLSRCYHNLGIIHTLQSKFIQAQEYFESAINLSLEAFGIDQQSLKNQKILDQLKQGADNYIQILFKQLLSKAYSMKQEALQLIYHEDNQQDIYNDIYQNYSCFYEQNTVKQLQNYSHKIIQLLTQSLKSFQPVQKLAFNNEQSFSEILKIFVFQEILEIMIYLKQDENTQSKLFTLVKELLFTAEEKILNNNNLFRDAAFYRNQQVLQIQKTKLYFLQGLKQYFQSNFSQSFEQFTLCLEEGTHYDPSLRKKSLFHINYLIKYIKESPQQVLMNEEICLELENNISLDFTILLQLDCYLEYHSFTKYLIDIQQLNVFRISDRIQILIYHSRLDSFMPFTIINKQQDLNLVIDSLINLNKFIIQDQDYQKKQLNLQEAIHLALYKILEFNVQEIIQPQQLYLLKNERNIPEIKKRLSQNQDKNQQNYEGKKDNIILLFSKEEECTKQLIDLKLHALYNFYQLKKPIVYHLKQFNFDFKSSDDLKSEYFSYQSFLDEAQFTSKLNLLRNEKKYNIHQEFLAILLN